MFVMVSGTGPNQVRVWAAERVSDSPTVDLDRSPVDLALSPDERWLATANEFANTISFISLPQRQIIDELPCGDHPADLAFTSRGDRLVATSSWSGELFIYRLHAGHWQQERVIDVGMQPHGLVLSPNGDTAYVGLMASSQVAVVNLSAGEVSARWAVGDWPRYLTLSPDGKRLAVGNAGKGEIEVLDASSGESLYAEPLSGGINLGQMQTSSDGVYAYFPWMIYRTNPITVDNIRRGWVLASRIGRVRLDGPAYREAISLDVPGEAVADPHDLAITSDGKRLVVSAAGTHELLLYRLTDLPFVAHGGPGDLIDRQLQNDRDRFDRLELGGRPLGLRIANDDRITYVANYLRNSVQVVDLEERKIVEEIQLGGPNQKTLVRQGMEIFYDGRRSLDQWYSCHTCHQEGGSNSRPMDTWNDGSEMTLKTVLPLHNVTQTFPWTWHGWQRNLDEAMHKSITSTMQGEPPSKDDKQALIAYLASLRLPPNPYREADGSLTETAQRGKQLFYSSTTGCADCHHGQHYSDGQVHEVGLGSESDVYKGYNTPSLVGLYRKVRWLHNGRARDLERVVKDLHRPDRVNGERELTDAEASDLIAFLKSL